MKIESVCGADIPALGFRMFRMKGAECTQAVERALEIGYRHLDTAGIHGNEGAVGQAVQSRGIPRDEPFLTTNGVAG